MLRYIKGFWKVWVVKEIPGQRIQDVRRLQNAQGLGQLAIVFSKVKSMGP